MKNIAERLDKDLRSTLNFIPQAVQDNLNIENIDKARTAYFNFVAPGIALAEGITDVHSQSLTIKTIDGSDIKLFVYTPIAKASEKMPTVYWIHGGGLVIGSAEADVLLLKLMAQQVKCKVVAVEYRLAPEHPFPIPLDDCYSGLKYICDNAQKLGIDSNKLAIAGQSAGGGLTACLAQLVRDRKEIKYPLRFQLLIYPMLDDRNTESLKEGEEDHYLWTKAANSFGWTSYLGKTPGTDETPKYGSAMGMEDLQGLPKTMILVGELDLFCLESIEYAGRLIEQGVSTELHVYPGAYHGSEGMNPEIFVSQQHNFMAFNGLQRVFGEESLF